MLCYGQPFDLLLLCCARQVNSSYEYHTRFGERWWTPYTSTGFSYKLRWYSYEQIWADKSAQSNRAVLCNCDVLDQDKSLWCYSGCLDRLKSKEATAIAPHKIVLHRRSIRWWPLHLDEAWWQGVVGGISNRVPSIMKLLRPTDCHLYSFRKQNAIWMTQSLPGTLFVLFT